MASPTGRVDGDERPFACSRCSKSFKRREHLNRHFRAHTLEKPFECRFCGKTYSRRSVFSPPSPFPFPTPLDRSYLLCNTDNKTRKILTRSETSSRATKRLYMALIDSPAPPPPRALQPLPLPPPPPPPHQLPHLLEQVTITPFWRPFRPSTAPTLSVRCLCRAHLHTLMLLLLPPPPLLHSRKPTR